MPCSAGLARSLPHLFHPPAMFATRSSWVRRTPESTTQTFTCGGAAQASAMCGKEARTAWPNQRAAAQLRRLRARALAGCVQRHLRRAHVPTRSCRAPACCRWWCPRPRAPTRGPSATWFAHSCSTNSCRVAASQKGCHRRRRRRCRRLWHQSSRWCCPRRRRRRRSLRALPQCPPLARGWL